MRQGLNLAVRHRSGIVFFQSRTQVVGRSDIKMFWWFFALKDVDVFQWQIPVSIETILHQPVFARYASFAAAAFAPAREIEYGKSIRASSGLAEP
jgi:hypothetical protein